MLLLIFEGDSLTRRVGDRLVGPRYWAGYGSNSGHASNERANDGSSGRARLPGKSSVELDLRIMFLYMLETVVILDKGCFQQTLSKRQVVRSVY